MKFSAQLVGLLCGVSAPVHTRVPLNFFRSPHVQSKPFRGHGINPWGPGTNPHRFWDLCQALVVRGGQKHDLDLPHIGSGLEVGLLVVGEGSSDAGDPPEVDPAKGEGTQLLLGPCSLAQLPQELP